MQDAGTRDDIQDRLKDFSRRLAAYRAKLESPHRELGQHMGHLVEYERAHEDLSKRFAQADLSTWERMAQTFEEDLNGLTDRFDKWAAYVDEEYKQTR
jgi:DNA repair exonuclease SbcCD ATPase subunit